MATCRILAVLLVLLPAAVLADTSMPDTPAGRALSAWLDAMNSDDRARQESFIRSYPTWGTLDDLAGWRADVGGYDLLEVYPGDPSNVFFRVKQRSRPVQEVGRLQVSSGKPVRIAALGAWRLPDGAKFEPVTLDDAARTRVVKRAAEALENFHVDPATGRKLAAALLGRAARGAYRDRRYIDSFAAKLNADLRAESDDPHLEVRFNYFIRPAGVQSVNRAEESRRLAADNCGFERAEHLRPNIGYLKFNFFADPEFCAATAGAALTFLADSDALILDLRDNNGGRGGMVELIASYLFEGRTHLSDSHRRFDDKTEESWTSPTVAGRKFLDKPVFLLISPRTFSAGEALSFVLQDLKRATLIGEATAGGSGAIEFKPIDDHFTLVLPTTRVTSAGTGLDWAGRGVQPDVNVPADQALETALGLASK